MRQSSAALHPSSVTHATTSLEQLRSMHESVPIPCPLSESSADSGGSLILPVASATTRRAVSASSEWARDQKDAAVSYEEQALRASPRENGVRKAGRRARRGLVSPGAVGTRTLLTLQ